MTPYISIVVPVYNEEGNLGKLFDQLGIIADGVQRTDFSHVPSF